MLNNLISLTNALCTVSIKSLSIAFVLLISTFFTHTVHAKESCVLTPHTANNTPLYLDKNTPSAFRLVKGKNQFTLTCNLKQSSVFTFTRPALERFLWQQDGTVKSPLKHNQMAIFMEKGDVNATLTIVAKASYVPRFTWTNATHFIKKAQLYNLIFGLFYGLCITLIFYVSIIGYGIKDKVFKLYGAYIFCLGSFIFFQEGQAFLFLPRYVSPIVDTLYLLSIGLTIISATWFMSAILQLKLYWPKTSQLLKVTALGVFVLFLERAFIGLPAIASISSNISGYASFLIVMAIFILCALQTQKKVNEAGLVFIALSCVFISITFRIVLPEYSPFIQRFGFVIAFTLESLLLAIAVSRRIYRLNYAKIQAEKHANYDHLCHIYNRRGFSIKAHDLLEQHTLKGGVLCFLYIDLDHFKAINDTYGHDVGDNVLYQVAQLLSTHMRSDDVIARIGGDEFVAMALFDNNEKFTQRVTLLEEKINTLKVESQGQIIPIFASVGLGQVNFTTTPKDLDVLLKAGDEAMYQQKSLRKAQTNAIYSKLHS